MNRNNILDRVQKTLDNPYIQESIKYLKYSLSIVLLILLLSVGLFFKFEVHFMIASIYFFVLFVSFAAVIVLGLIGLYYLIFSYQKREKRNNSQLIALSIFVLLCFSFFILIQVLIDAAGRFIF